MKKSIIKKLALIQEQYHSIANQLADEAIQSDGKKMVELSKEFSRIEPVVVLFEKYLSLDRTINVHFAIENSNQNATCGPRT